MFLGEFSLEEGRKQRHGRIPARGWEQRGLQHSRQHLLLTLRQHQMDRLVGGMWGFSARSLFPDIRALKFY